MTSATHILSLDLCLALDPGSQVTGWSVMNARERLVQAGVLLPEKRDLTSEFRIAQICDSLRFLLDEWQPGVIVAEWTSGKVNVHRHRGGGAGLAVHGAATGAIWREAMAWRRSLPVAVQREVKIVLARENEWTGGTHKRDRIAAVASEYPAYRPEQDAGGDIADAIALSWWYWRVCRIEALAAGGAR